MDAVAIHIKDIREWAAGYRLIRPGAVKEMVCSIMKDGQLQPVILQKQDGCYNLIDGIKRYRAAVELDIDTLQSQVFEVDTVMAMVMIIHYNRGGHGLNMYEQGLIISTLVREYRISQKELSRILHQSRSWICRRLGMIERLLPGVQDAIRMDSISVSHGRELVKLPRGNQQKALDVVVNERLTTRECAIVVDRLLKSATCSDSDYILSNPREVIRQVLDRDKLYDPRLSDHGNRLLKARELLRLQANILRSALESSLTGSLDRQEYAILFPELGELPGVMKHLGEVIHKTIEQYER